MATWILAVAMLLPQIEVPEFHTAKAQGSYVLSVSAADATQRLPLIVDFHGACAPSRLGANVTQGKVWSEFVRRVPALVVGLNGRTRAWNMTRGERGDVAYALHVIESVRKTHEFDADRVYLAGFSSGADFLCSAGLQAAGSFAGSLVVCPGPSNVVGLRGGELVQKVEHPFLFVTGEHDYIRKDGAWQAFVALDDAGGKAMYREVPGLGHAFPGVAEYARAFGYLRSLAEGDELDDLAIARAAFGRQDYLCASTHAMREACARSQALLAAIEVIGEKLSVEAAAIDVDAALGRAFEAWWRVRTQFHRFPKLARQAQQALDQMEDKVDRRTLYRARRAWFESGSRWKFDRYLAHEEIAERLRVLAEEHPDRVHLSSMGRTIEGRDLWVVEITDRSARPANEKPAAWIQGGIHGNEASSVMTALYCAWQMGANPDRRRAVDRLLREVTLYVAPAVNPDALQHYITEPHSHWRPRFNYRPNDADGDGRTDEDGYEDLNGDGEIGQMYVADALGPFVLQDGKLVRGAGDMRYRHVGREGVDDDGDGAYSEDPRGGVNLNRNFPVGFRVRRDFEGSRGVAALSEPETRAITTFVREHRNIALFLDYHNAARCVFYWLGEDDAAAADDAAMYHALAQRANVGLGYTPRPLRHNGAGLSIAWAYGELGIPAAIVELEVGSGPDAKYLAETWPDGAFLPAEPFRHPQLGDILLGADHSKIAKRNPHPHDIRWQAQRNWDWVRDELKLLPRLTLDNPRVTRDGEEIVVRGGVQMLGELPADTARARRIGVNSPIRLVAEGARLVGDVELEVPAAGVITPFEVRMREPSELSTLLVSHPRAGTVRLPVAWPRREDVPIRRAYEILPGYRTTADAIRATNAHFEKGVAQRENGPVFELANTADALRVAVLLGEWRDRRHTVPAADFERAFFADGDYRMTATGQPAYGSVRDFYREMSYGRFEIRGEVFDWVELPGSCEEYRKASFGASLLCDRLEAAVLARDGGGALDGYDGLVFVWAGNPVHRVSNLWPMRVKRKNRPGVVAFKMGEFYRGEMAPIGVACHELGHTFGVNDKYGLGAPARPLGPWCLMCRGTHGGGDSARRRPFHFCAWCKMVVGWVQPVVVDPATPQRLALRPISSGAEECYRVLLRPDGSEYLLLENRRREGFFTELPSAGLVVLRVGPNDRPSAPQKQVQLLPAHGLPAPARGRVASPAAVAWPSADRTELVVDGVRLSEIRLEDDVIYFMLDR